MDSATIKLRSGFFALLLVIVALVGDGLPKFGPPLVMQMVLIPITLTFCCVVFFLLCPIFPTKMIRGIALYVGGFRTQLVLCYWLQCMFICIFLYQSRLYARFGYSSPSLSSGIILLIAVAIVGVVGLLNYRVKVFIALAVVLTSYALGQALSVTRFPLNYLRSDMLPVIFWSGRALLADQNPYQHFHVGNRIYDFPYLPGMLMVFAPAQVLSIDLRWAAVFYTWIGMLIVFWATKPRYRLMSVALIGLFVLNPYLQYRHDLYTQGHFLSLIIVFALMQRRYFIWSAVAFGISMVISQFSWVIFPFFLMNAVRRGGWREAARMAFVSGISVAILAAPFLSSGAGNIAHNAVGQWDELSRPIARPINFAFWASYFVKPSHLKWVQLFLLSGIFLYCWLKGRCVDLEDTLRWMITALTVFILLNVLLDGYFYLMLLVPMLVYTCVANGWWSTPLTHTPPLEREFAV